MMVTKDERPGMCGVPQELTVSLGNLHPHPENSNVMPGQTFDKLVNHIGRTGRYPPIIVRPMPQEALVDNSADECGFQIIDGHHRVSALKRLEIRTAHCLVWDVDDQEVLLLLATLNRLRGDDDQRKRASLLARLAKRTSVAALSAQLPEQVEDIRRLVERTHAPPPPRRPISLERMPVAVHFFLTLDQKRRLDSRLASIPGSRVEALMLLIDGGGVSEVHS